MANNKRKLHRIVALGIGIVLFASCSSKSNYQNSEIIDWNDFKTIEHLTGNVVAFDSMLMKPWLLQVYDTLLVTCNLDTDIIFHIFDLKSKKQIAQRISRGQGPTEMLVPFFIPNDSVVMFYDLGTSSVSKYDLHDFVTSMAPLPLERIKLDEQIMGGMVLVEDGIIGSPYHPEYAFYKFDNSGKKTGIFGEYPVSDITYSNTEIVEAYRPVLTSNLTDKVAVCYYWTDLIEIYDKEGKLDKRIHGPEHIYPHFEGHIDGEMSFSKTVPGRSRDAFYCPVSVGDNIFVLFNGKFPNEEGYNILANQIFVFDWDGKPQKIYELDRGISNMDVDEKNKKIYGISDDPEYQVVEFSYD